ncbi:MAG: sugar ABC transporter permease [Aggregatilineales bacterium]
MSTVAAVPPSAAPERRPRLSPQRREALTFYLLVSPWVIGFLAFTLFPLVVSFFISLTRWNMLSPPVWIGLDNYARMFSDDNFYQSLRVTITYSIASVPLRLAVALFLAILLSEATRMVGFFRTSFYIPSVVASVAAAVLWQWILNPRFGPLNAFLGLFGIAGPRWFSDPNWALWGLVLMSAWGIGGEMLIFLAGLKSIPRSLYEAAIVDGARGTQCFWKITIPLLTPTIFFNLVMSIIGALQTFDAAFVISTARAGDIGSPLRSTLFYMLNVYKEAFTNLNLGYATALAWTLFVLIVVVTYFVNRTSKRWVFYGE